MGKDDHCYSATASMHWRRASAVDGYPGQRKRRHDVGAVVSRGNVLDRDLPVLAETNVDLRARS